MVMTAKSYHVQRHVTVTVNMEVPPPPPASSLYTSLNQIVSDYKGLSTHKS